MVGWAGGGGLARMRVEVMVGNLWCVGSYGGMRQILLVLSLVPINPIIPIFMRWGTAAQIIVNISIN